MRKPFEPDRLFRTKSKLRRYGHYAESNAQSAEGTKSPEPLWSGKVPRKEKRKNSVVRKKKTPKPVYTKLPFTMEWPYSDKEIDTIRDFNLLYWSRGNFTWGQTKFEGATCWNTPTDLWTFQEIIEELRPKLVVECGTGPGGTALWLAHAMKRLVPDGKVVTIDIDDTASEEIKKKWAEVGNVEFIHSNSVAEPAVSRVRKLVKEAKGNVFVILDSKHSYEHVLAELKFYGCLVRKGGYIVVCDTMVVGVRNAIFDWLSKKDNEWCQDPFREKYMLSFCHGGFLVHADQPPPLIISVGMAIVTEDPVTEVPVWATGAEIIKKGK